MDVWLRRGQCLKELEARHRTVATWIKKWSFQFVVLNIHHDISSSQLFSLFASIGKDDRGDADGAYPAENHASCSSSLESACVFWLLSKRCRVSKLAGVGMPDLINASWLQWLHFGFWHVPKELSASLSSLAH